MVTVLNASIITSPLVKTYSLEEFWELPDPPDCSKLELIAGVIYMTPPPEYTHDNVVTRLNRFITANLIATKDEGKLYIPRAAIWTSKRTYLEPDLFYVSAELAAQLDPKHRTTADLVVEVISPGSAMYDRTTKKDTYAALGVRELWLIDEVAETVEVFKLVGAIYGEVSLFEREDVVASNVLPNLMFKAAELFAD